MSDDVIKNINRNKSPKDFKPSEPEYKRRGITPLSAHESQFSVDGDVVPDNGHFIDNNEYLDIDRPRTAFNNPEQNASSIPHIGEYILMIFGKIVLIGPIKNIELKVKNIMYGEDLEFAEQKVSIEDVIVLKRMNLKMGIFVE